MRNSIISLILLPSIAYAMHPIQTKKEPSKETLAAVKAIEDGSIENLKQAFSQGADISYKDDDQNNLLMLSVDGKLNSISFYLLNNIYFQQSINAQNMSGITTLMAATRCNNTKLVKKLLKISGINPDVQTRNKHFALYFAVQNKNHNIISLLIANRANPMLQDKLGATIAHFGCILRETHDEQTLRKIMDARDSNGNTHIHLAVTANISRIAQIHNSTVNELLTSALNALIKHGVSIWSKNNNNELPIESAYKRYEALLEQYKKEMFRSYLEEPVQAHREAIHILSRYYTEKLYNQPIYIKSTFASELNIETYIAKNHASENDYQYSDCSDEYKEIVKQDLSKIPTAWISEYIPPQIL